MLRRQPSGKHADDDESLGRSFGPQRRLRTAAEFAALLQAPRGASIRANRRLLGVIAAWRDGNGDAQRVRFGVTVGRRNARRAVDRALVKRIVREACRHQAPALERCAARSALYVEVGLRLKSPLVDAAGKALAMSQWRRQLRAEADDLLLHVLTELTTRACRLHE